MDEEEEEVPLATTRTTTPDSNPNDEADEKTVTENCYGGLSPFNCSTTNIILLLSVIIMAILIFVTVRR